MSSFQKALLQKVTRIMRVFILRHCELTSSAWHVVILGHAAGSETSLQERHFCLGTEKISKTFAKVTYVAENPLRTFSEGHICT